VYPSGWRFVVRANRQILYHKRSLPADLRDLILVLFLGCFSGLSPRVIGDDGREHRNDNHEELNPRECSEMSKPVRHGGLPQSSMLKCHSSYLQSEIDEVSENG
jgi:hypothetical protein